MSRTLYLLLLLLWPLSLQAVTRYVDGNSIGGTCSDGNTGTSITAPKCSIGSALSVTGAGDIVSIRAGTYAENLTNPFASGGSSEGTRVLVRGHPGDAKPVWRPVGLNWMLYLDGTNQAWITFQDIIFDGQGASGGALPKVTGSSGPVGAHHIRFVNCVWRNGFRNPTSSPDTCCMQWSHTHHNEIIGGTVESAQYALYIASEASDNLIDGLTVLTTTGYGIHCYTPDSTSNNNVVQNSSIANAGTELTQCGMLLSCGDNNQVYNNIVYGATGGGICVGHAAPASNTKVYNNTLVGNTLDPGAGFYGLYIPSGSGHIARNNIIWNNGGGNISTGGGTTESNNLLSNPNFVNLGAGDFHLLSSSAAINYGTTGSGIPTTDKDGNSRVGNPDAGAYEFVAGTTPTIGIFYVSPPTGSPAGDDSRDCTTATTASTPKATAASAFPCGASGSTFRFYTGTYGPFDTASVPIASGTSWATATRLEAVSGQTPVFASPTGVTAFFRSAEQFLIVDGLTFDSQSGTGTNAVAVMDGAQFIRFQNCTMKNAYYEPLYIQNATAIEVLTSAIFGGSANGPGIGLNGAAQSLIKGNSIHNNALGIELTSTSAARLEQNQIFSNLGAGIGGALGSGSLIANNLLYSNGAQGLVVTPSTTGAQVYNNTFWSNTGTPIQINSGASTTAVANNLYYQNGNSDAIVNNGTGTTQTTNFAGNPSFVAPGPPTNFHTASPSTTGGGTTLAEVTVDYAGTGRDAPYSIGAYEDAVPAAPGTPGRGLPFASTHFLSSY